MNIKDKPVRKVCRDKIVKYTLNGKFHRINGPAIERPDGAKLWYKNGERHRKDGPAFKYPNGTEKWFIQNKPFKGPKK